LTASLSVTGVDLDSVERPALTVRVEEFVSTSMRPLLPYIFFADNSAEIPARYRRVAAGSADGFRVDAIHAKDALETYHEELNIIGSRLRANPFEAIALVGCNADHGAEAGNHALSQQRAAAVRDYLHDVWGIATNRIGVSERDLPALPTHPGETYGDEENRRVEIRSDSWNIMEPVISHDTIRTATPPVIRFRSAHRADAGMGQWWLDATQSSTIIKHMSGSADVPDVVDWHIDAERESIPRAAIPIEAVLNITDRSGQNVSAAAPPLPVEQLTVRRKRDLRLADHIIDNYSLILFDFGKIDIGPLNKRVCTFITEHVLPSSVVHIDGYTDRAGNTEFNKALSQDRAGAVAVALRIPAANAMGRGDEVLLYTNDTPEGRFYCRTVNVRVETPVQ
jgi:outer membrane protein OmpA-like peptidoglycan-associated protein